MIYNRELVLNYIEKYTYNPNIQKYPYYKEDDCANFVSQVLHSGGMKELGNKWDSFSSWFCYTNNESDLKKAALTWRAARYFRKHWGNENGAGFNRAKQYYEITVSEAIQDYSNLYNLLQTGDVIQYGKPENHNIPYHTQVVYKKGYNSSLKKYDILMAQHTKNMKGISLYKYLDKQLYKNIKNIYIYIIG